ncbi:TPA: M23 family metallopeptidase [Neisseria gonorrhoeae]|uniref:M23 family metallopeptidase n=1 Tax=Neisseria gonorrhoeae TaxID=485 RepID=UPI00049F59F2|nr:M23 family metallopeptidase [Neisseria gonorrhoeae]KDM99747.1 peptidase M23 family protein [Neisseria gonorrhoeae]KDN01670.1 peptidase M23 family protein [Neisseria gonorrhoeae]KDN03882.1 peptidase M23 family protein [Neisseria gonorrhoeae]MCC9010723.1 M23 family metallopeptidase [Neisseria gonorrhoeae]MCC9024570.1 M23 family metallopeptidase [Neisseria gonorrhoeae]
MGPLLPDAHTIISPFGKRVHPILKKVINHKGEDYRDSINTPLLAPFSGRVVESRYQANTVNGKTVGWGHTVVIEAPNGVRYRASHMNGASPLRFGETVSKGQQIGNLGASGGVTGPHLDAMLYSPSGKILPVSAYRGKTLNEIGKIK